MRLHTRWLHAVSYWASCLEMNFHLPNPYNIKWKSMHASSLMIDLCTIHVGSHVKLASSCDKSSIQLRGWSLYYIPYPPLPPGMPGILADQQHPPDLEEEADTPPSCASVTKSSDAVASPLQRHSSSPESGQHSTTHDPLTSEGF